MAIPKLSHSNDPEHNCEKIEDFPSGQFYDSNNNDYSHLNKTQLEWIQSLKRIVNSEITLSLTVDDFKKYFKAKQEQTASSPSG